MNTSAPHVSIEIIVQHREISSVLQSAHISDIAFALGSVILPGPYRIVAFRYLHFAKVLRTGILTIERWGPRCSGETLWDRRLHCSKVLLYVEVACLRR